MNLPSFLWLWKIAAWSMGAVLLLAAALLLTGLQIFRQRRTNIFWIEEGTGIRTLHKTLGILLLGFVVELLLIGIVGTLGHFGSLGHSLHLWVGLAVVGLSLGSAWQGWQGSHRWHLLLNGFLLAALVWVTWTGWEVVQKYLPPS